MHIGVVPTLAPFDGGLHQYTLTILEALAKLSESAEGTQYTLFLQPEVEPLLPKLSSARWRRSLLRPPLVWSQPLSAFRRLRHRIIPRRQLPNSNDIRHRSEYTWWFRQHGLDWILYTAPTVLSFEAGFPYVMPVHDLQHRLQPEFPEVSANGEWSSREYLFRNAVRHATLILADSEVGRQDIIECYGAFGASPDRVKVLPYLPATYLSADIQETERTRVREKYRLPARYLFYPAQFWPHKNHARIIEAVVLLKGAGCEVNVVFCGSHSGEIREDTFRGVLTFAHQLALGQQICYLGYVPNEDMSGLYAEAAGLVMPTLFGPTNIPVLEAWALGCPVLTSDLRGIREQVGDAGLLVDPLSVPAIAEGMRGLWEDEALRQTLIERGRRRVRAYTPEDFRGHLADIIREANGRVAERRRPDTWA